MSLGMKGKRAKKISRRTNKRAILIINYVTGICIELDGDFIYRAQFLFVRFQWFFPFLMHVRVQSVRWHCFTMAMGGGWVVNNMNSDSINIIVHHSSLLCCETDTTQQLSFPMNACVTLCPLFMRIHSNDHTLVRFTLIHCTDKSN